MGRSLVKVLCMMMLAAVAAAGVSCSRPVSYEKFVSVEDREANGRMAREVPRYRYDWTGEGGDRA